MGTAPNHESALTITTSGHDAATVVTVAGVVDHVTSPELRAEVAAVLSKGVAALIIDLTSVEFLDSSGLGVLVAARGTAPSDVPIAVITSNESTRRFIEVVGIDSLVPLYATLEEALATLH